MEIEDYEGYESAVYCPYCGSDEVYAPTWVRILHDPNRPFGTGRPFLDSLFWDPQVTDPVAGDALPHRCTACGKYIANSELAPQIFGEDEEDSQQPIPPSQ